ncbi:hypothetical protein LTR37_005137 [Vermiconidia calcicola]|uniref:Uncharacterized protein n=1 Tax=Vermiconidia calcicola TaxID=1690605 RepID=A0ACC3NKB1_9PEZI|nr:hypothetical protein LTR37_005137 [Vermiconidia calcicola]
MAEPTISQHQVPGVFGGDLPEKERDAYEEGQDADTAQGTGVVNDEQEGPKRETVVDPGKKDGVTASSKSSEAGEHDLEKAEPSTTTDGEPEEPRDPNVVDWDGPDDPQNPYNWPASKKWSNIAILSFLTLLTPLASSMFAPGVPDVIEEFNEPNPALATFVVSVYILGFAFGPLFFAPLSEMYGRVLIYNIGNVFFVIFTVGCALATDMNMLIGFRFLAGCCGIAPITNGGGTIADLMVAEKRGSAMSIWAIGPLLGPVIGPVCGGFLAQNEGWRWIFWVLAIASGCATVWCLLVARETYAPVLLERKAAKMRKETGNQNLVSKLDLGISTKELWRRSLLRPMKLMFLSPICALMSLYLAIVYGIMYLLFTTFTFVFQDQYGFSQSIVGLVYIGLGLGMLIGLAVLGATSDRIMKSQAKKYSEGKVKPEYRLPLLMYSGPFIPIGLFIYGWTTEKKTQWAVPLFGTLLVGVGLIGAFMCLNTYLVDAYTRYAASAMAANTILRSIFGAVFPLFGLQMYDALGLGWGNSLLGFLSLALVPIPFLFYWYGEKIRTHPRFQVKL